MDIVEIKISKLNPAVYNPRVISESQMAKLVKSIDHFGFVEPVIVNKDYTIIGGHQRIKAFEILGRDSVPCVFVDLDKQNEKALNIALNKMGGEFDVDMLQSLLGELNLSGLDMDLTGFDTLDAIFDISDEETEETEIKPEIVFTEILREEHNYIVLYFDNDLDWLQLESLYPLKQVRKPISIKNGNINNDKMAQYGVGRVINGAEFMEQIKKELSI